MMTFYDCPACGSAALIVSPTKHNEPRTCSHCGAQMVVREKPLSGKSPDKDPAQNRPAQTPRTDV